MCSLQGRANLLDVCGHAILFKIRTRLRRTIDLLHSILRPITSSLLVPISPRQADLERTSPRLAHLVGCFEKLRTTSSKSMIDRDESIMKGGKVAWTDTSLYTLAFEGTQPSNCRSIPYRIDLQWLKILCAKSLRQYGFCLLDTMYQTSMIFKDGLVGSVLLYLRAAAKRIGMDPSSYFSFEKYNARAPNLFQIARVGRPNLTPPRCAQCTSAYKIVAYVQSCRKNKFDLGSD